MFSFKRKKWVWDYYIINFEPTIKENPLGFMQVSKNNVDITIRLLREKGCMITSVDTH